MWSNMLLNNIRIHSLNLLNFVYVHSLNLLNFVYLVVFDVETTLKNAQIRDSTATRVAIFFRLLQTTARMHIMHFSAGKFSSILQK